MKSDDLENALLYCLYVVLWEVALTICLSRSLYLPHYAVQ